MATRRNRVRKSRKVRKTRKGGFLGIHATKTDEDNERNCKDYWHKDDNRPGLCTKAFEGQTRVHYFDYPGYLTKKAGRKVTVKRGFILDGTEYKVGQNVPEGLY